MLWLRISTRLLKLETAHFLFDTIDVGQRYRYVAHPKNGIAILERDASDGAKDRLVVGDQLIARILRRDTERVGTVWLLDALAVQAVPDKRMNTGTGWDVACKYDIARRVGNIQTRRQGMK